MFSVSRLLSQATKMRNSFLVRFDSDYFPLEHRVMKQRRVMVGDVVLEKCCDQLTVVGWVVAWQDAICSNCRGRLGSRRIRKRRSQGSLRKVSIPDAKKLKANQWWTFSVGDLQLPNSERNQFLLTNVRRQQQKVFAKFRIASLKIRCY